MPEFLQLQIVTRKRGQVDVLDDCFILNEDGARLGRLPITSYRIDGQAHQPEQVSIDLYGHRTVDILRLDEHGK